MPALRRAFSIPMTLLRARARARERVILASEICATVSPQGDAAALAAFVALEKREQRGGARVSVLFTSLAAGVKHRDTIILGRRRQ